MTSRPDQTTRRLVAKQGGYARVATASSPAAVSAPARAAFLARFERQVDPDGSLPADVRAAKAQAALGEQMSAVALARHRRRTGRRPADEQVLADEQPHTCPTCGHTTATPAEPEVTPEQAAGDPPTPAAVDSRSLSWEEFLAARGLDGKKKPPA